MNSPAPSASSRILDYLKTLSPGAEFTSVMLREELVDISDGAVTGFLAKLQSQDAIKVVGKTGLTHVYQVVDLSNITVRKSSSIGSRPGRSVEGTNSAERVAKLLRQIADDVEGFHSDLQSYSTADLLRELSRRERVAASAREK